MHHALVITRIVLFEKLREIALETPEKCKEKYYEKYFEKNHENNTLRYH